MKLDYEWDEAKNLSNIRDHAVSFNEAIAVFDDPFHLMQRNSIQGGEERLEAIGMIRGMLILLVVHTVINEDTADERTRLISARRATPRERRTYEQNRARIG